MFKIDTGDLHPDIRATTSGMDEGQRIIVTNYKRAVNVFNKIKSNIEAHEDQDALDAYMAREDMMLDALHLFDPSVSEELRDIYETHRACLVHGGAARPAHPGNPQSPNAQTGNSGNERKDNECIW